MIKIAKISRMYEYERESSIRVGWLDKFVEDFYKESENKDSKKESKTIVELSRERGYDSLYQSISSMLGVKNSVEGRIQELQEQIGLKSYLNRISSEENNNSIIKDKNASVDGTSVSNVFQDIPSEIANNIISFIMNKIHSFNGHIDVPAIELAVETTFKDNGIGRKITSTNGFKDFVFNLIQESKPANVDINTNLGKSDQNDLNNAISENNDFFRNMMPNRS